MKRRSDNAARQFRWRGLLVMSGFALVSVVVVARAMQLQVFDKEFLERQAESYSSVDGAQAAMADFYQMLFGLNEFFYIR